MRPADTLLNSYRVRPPGSSLLDNWPRALRRPGSHFYGRFARHRKTSWNRNNRLPQASQDFRRVERLSHFKVHPRRPLRPTDALRPGSGWSCDASAVRRPEPRFRRCEPCPKSRSWLEFDPASSDNNGAASTLAPCGSHLMTSRPDCVCRQADRHGPEPEARR